MKNYLSIDIGGTNTKYGIIDFEGNIIFKNKFPTKKNKSEFYSNIKELSEYCKEKYNIEGLAISVPGIVDTDNGYLVTAGAMTELYGTYLKNDLEKLIGMRVSIENDVNCVALAEKWLGNGTDSNNFICIAIGTGIGGAIIINNELYRGKNFRAGEFGFILSEEIKHNDTRMATLSMNSSTQFGIVDAYNQMSNTKLNGEEVTELYLHGDKKATDVFSRFYKKIAIALFGLSFSLDPDKILIGGGISEQTKIISEIERHMLDLMKYHIDLKNLAVPKIEACKFNNDSGIIGALYNFLKIYKEV